MGASFHHRAFHCTVAELSEFLSSQSVELWGADVEGEPVAAVAPPGRLALAVGNEGAGLSSSIRDRVARFVSLPIAGSIESLNVSVAAGILLYQLRK